MSLQENPKFRRFANAAPFAFSAALALAKLVNPGMVSAHSGMPIPESSEMFTQCGGANIPSSHTVVVEQISINGKLRTVESDWGERRGECDNSPAQTSSIKVETIRSDQNGLIEDIASFPNPCPKAATGFRISDVITSSPTIYFESLSGVNRPEIGITLDRTDIRLRRYNLSGVVECKTLGGSFIPVNDRLNLAVNEKP